MSIHLPDLIAEEQQRIAVASAAGPDSRPPEPLQPTPRSLGAALDSASLLAKLRAQLVRREAAASGRRSSDFDRSSAERRMTTSRNSLISPR